LFFTLIGNLYKEDVLDFIIRSKNIELDDNIKSYAEKKIKDKIEKILDRVVKLEVKFIFEKNPRINLNNLVEVTVFTSGSVIRVTDSGGDLYGAVDKVNGKLERAIKRYKERLVEKGRKNNSRKEEAIAGDISQEVRGAEDKIKRSIVKTKTFALKPIPPEEAVLQMEMLGHDFFVFINSETEKTAVVYRRKDKNYGLIEPYV
jgi:putative sigma-54 modulation protein